MKRLAIIPARGGSKRIPRKNVKPFLGKPVIAYSIEAALASELFDEVMVSTEDEEIAAVAREYGATVPFMRSAAAADDFATTLDVLLEVLDAYRERGTEIVSACCIYAAAPFVTAARLREADDLLRARELDCVFPVLRFGFPIQRALRLSATNTVEMFSPEHLTTRSQDLEAAFHDAGMFYTFNVARVRAAGKLYTENSGCLVVPELEAHDIDTPEDWEAAEFKYRLLRERRG
ncbi:MAG: pseudaminic acid cytidylyltransferase [Saprospiraceae bacterium]